MEQWLMVIQDIGFPIFVSFYLMHRVESKLEEIKNALLSLSKV
ncbi:MULTISPECIES: YvrJ family protein [Psychrobacillus]|uniref:YvrJ family protein n=1 Tax=Psychrobacillus faecigallinarum TaxID=2762235 RepID=A0ABR8R9N7_9BACI|nr:MULTISPECIES: YvrJ family protein [Psychrobacillus]MBD7944429.1 YvrJ family protein [Psychrobacillus faecigallinarum]QEY19660.1 YvrJ family protein [Psychrobacillus sp. AK 1817]QGM30196.1 YvrJ family protein [Bacillus sp. N3536]